MSAERITATAATGEPAAPPSPPPADSETTQQGEQMNEQTAAVRAAAEAMRQDTCERPDCVSCLHRRESADWLTEYAENESPPAPPPADSGNTHYAVLYFSGDPDGEHPDEELCGEAPHLTLIAAGPEAFCWESLEAWVAKHPLRMWEHGEVLTRHPSVVRRQPIEENER